MATDTRATTVPLQVEWKPAWLTWVAATTACLDALGVECDLADVAGRSGYAFELWIHEGLCPSGPTALDWHALLHKLDHRLDSETRIECTGIAKNTPWHGHIQQLTTHVGPSRRRQAVLRRRGRGCRNCRFSGVGFWSLHIRLFVVCDSSFRRRRPMTAK